MNISSIRFGFATNSSSTHSLVFLPQDKKVKDDMCGEGFGDFGWQNFTVISDKEKLHYLTYYRDWETDRKSTRLNSSHRSLSRMPSSA